VTIVRGKGRGQIGEKTLIACRLAAKLRSWSVLSHWVSKQRALIDRQCGICGKGKKKVGTQRLPALWDACPRALVVQREIRTNGIHFCVVNRGSGLTKQRSHPGSPTPLVPPAEWARIYPLQVSSSRNDSMKGSSAFA
jgi:hypothetical protein